MRIAVLADIHGNLRALEAVRKDVTSHAPDVVVNLGDHVSGPLQAAATADLLMSERYLTIRGNHDRQLLDRPPDTMGLSDRAAHAQLDRRHLEWLANLPPTHLLDGAVFLCHGSPSSDLQYLTEEIVGDRARLADPAVIAERLRGVQAALVLCGHSHLPRSVRLPGGTVVVNPGSVGLQAYDDDLPSRHYIETGSPHARYAILDWSPKSLRIDLIAVEYDWESAAKDAVQGNRSDWAHALATGYALRAS